MKRLGIKYLSEGMEVGRPIYRADGRILLGKGVKLTKKYISRLPQQGITSIYVKDRRLEDVEVSYLISQNLQITALKKVKEVNDAIADKYNSYKKGNSKKSDNLRFLEDIHTDIHEIAKEIVEDFSLVKNPMINLVDSRSNDDYIYNHMLNVAILAILIGKGLGYKEDKLVDLAKGCLIHDVGILIKVPEEVRMKKGDLTDEEYNLIKEHAEFGYRYLKQMRGFSILSAHVIYQHHERYNGKGYPRGLKEDGITEYGYIAGLADVYDAITNNKVYKLRVLPDKAREFLLVSKDKFFPGYIIEQLLKRIPAYPNGTTVLLSNRALGVVVKQNKDNLSRPVVRILNEKGEELKKGYDINLNKTNSLLIKKVLD
ncbi:MAG: HD-GYP domain-containing protein [Fusobacteriota bacterium]